MNVCRWLVISTACFSLLLIALRIPTGAADPPVQLPNELPAELPAELPTFRPPANASPTQQMDVIQRALDGDPDAMSGDPLFDELLQKLRRDGSVIDGSVLDDPTLDNPQELIKGTQRGQELTAREQDDQRALAAEALLRAARLLRRAPQDPRGSVQDSKSRDKLVNDMRVQAVRLLSEQ